MTKEKAPSPNQPPAAEQRPTQPAFEPLSRSQFWGGIGLGGICLMGTVIGLGAWLDPSIAASLDSADRPGQLSAWLLPFIFPLLVPIALYFFWSTWREWRETRTFERHKQTTTGTITHLWFDRPYGRSKQYYVGYHFGDGHEIYQKVHSRTYSRLAIGEAVTVAYVPSKPRLSRVDLQKRPQKRPAFPSKPE